MAERAGIMTFEEILNNFSPQRAIITGKDGAVPYHISRNPNGLILYAVPDAVWLKRGEQPENQAAV